MKTQNTHYTYVDKTQYGGMNKEGVLIPIIDKIPILSDKAETKGDLDISFDNISLHGATIITLSVNLLNNSGLEKLVVWLKLGLKGLLHFITNLLGLRYPKLLRRLDSSSWAKGSSLHFFGSAKLLKVDILDTQFSWSYETAKDSEGSKHYDWRRAQLVPEEELKVYGQMIRLGRDINRSLIASGNIRVTLNVLLTGSVDRVEMHYDTRFRRPYRFK